MENRLDELGINDDNLYADSGDIEIELKGPMNADNEDETPDDSRFLDQFYKDVGSVKGTLEDVQELTEKLHNDYTSSLSEVKTIGSSKPDKSHLNKQRKKISTLLADVKDQLKKIESDNKSIGESSKGRTAEVRMRENMYNSLLKDFSTRVNRFQEVELEYKKGKRKEVTRKLEIVNDGDVTNKMVESFLQNPRPIFIEKLKGTSQWKTVQNEYQVAMETREDLLHLETNMNELVEMFTDMYALVNMQQDLIDNIERNVQDTAEYINKGTKQIQKAKKDSKTGKLCSLAMVVVIIVLIIIVIVVLVIVLGAGGTLLAVFLPST